MNLPATLARSLEHHTAQIKLRAHTCTTLTDAAQACGVSSKLLVQGILLEDCHGVMLAVLPCDRSIDLGLLRRVTGRELRPADAQRIAGVFSDCIPEALPPLARPYGVGAIVDESLHALPECWFTPGDPTLLLGMAQEEFLALHSKSQQAPFTRASQREVPPVPSQPQHGLRPLGKLAERVRALKQLPPAPLMATHLLRIRNHAAPTLDELCAVIARDPHLCTQLVHHARTGHPAHKVHATSLHEVISRVIGFDQALHMALGFAISHHFHGSAAHQAFWHEALLAATLAEALARQLPAHHGVDPATAYLAGLLHNIGYLLMSEQLHSEFEQFREEVAAHPELPSTLIEKRLFGLGHSHVGGRLMSAWQMPEEIAVCAREHHNELYSGPHAAYVHLLIACDALLRGHSIGDSRHDEIPGITATRLGLDPRSAFHLASQVVAGNSTLDELARALCA